MKTACCRIKTTDGLEDAAIVLLLIKNSYELDFGFDVFVYKFKTGSKVSNVISTFPTLLRYSLIFLPSSDITNLSTSASASVSRVARVL